jgi:hypothetical protein
MASGEPKVEAIVTHHAKQLAAASAPPFRFFHDHLRAVDLRFEGSLKMQCVCEADRACAEIVWADKNCSDQPSGRKT